MCFVLRRNPSNALSVASGVYLSEYLDIRWKGSLPGSPRRLSAIPTVIHWS